MWSSRTRTNQESHSHHWWWELLLPAKENVFILQSDIRWNVSNVFSFTTSSSHKRHPNLLAKTFEKRLITQHLASCLSLRASWTTWMSDAGLGLYLGSGFTFPNYYNIVVLKLTRWSGGMRVETLGQLAMREDGGFKWTSLCHILICISELD